MVNFIDFKNINPKEVFLKQIKAKYSFDEYLEIHKRVFKKKLPQYFEYNGSSYIFSCRYIDNIKKVILHKHLQKKDYNNKDYFIEIIIFLSTSGFYEITLDGIYKHQLFKSLEETKRYCEQYNTNPTL